MDEEKKTNEEKQTNPAHKILNKLRRNSEDLRIKRVPKPTLKAFKELADSEFCGDYGMTLKWLVDDIISADAKMMIAKLNEHHQRISSLEQALSNAQPEEDTGVKRMTDGSLRKVRK